MAPECGAYHGRFKIPADPDDVDHGAILRGNPTLPGPHTPVLTGSVPAGWIDLYRKLATNPDPPHGWGFPCSACHRIRSRKRRRYDRARPPFPLAGSP